ncbi:MAG: glycosyltransferase [Elainellaceae cyanobacterium]
MKVLHVIPSVAPVRGGPSQAIFQMVCALNQQNIKADIATTDDNGSFRLDVPLHHSVQYYGVPVRFFPRFSPAAAAVREFAFSSAFTTWLWHSITDYDLIHVHAIFSYVPTAAMAIARLKGVPYVVRPLGQLCQWSLQQSQRRKQLYLDLIERANLSHANAIHFTSDAERVEAKSLGLKTPGVVIPHGLTLAPTISDAPAQLRQWLQLPGDEPIILFLSRLHPKKGLEVLIKSLMRMADQRFTLLIAGSGDPSYEAKLRHLINQSGLGDRTRLVGFVSGHEKDLLLQGATLFTLTSHSENFGVAVLEALASRLPCVVTPGVALASMISRENLGWVPDLDEGAIANAISEALVQPEKRQEIGDRARQFIEAHYTWEQVASRLIDTYQSILIRESNFRRLS